MLSCVKSWHEVQFVAGGAHNVKARHLALEWWQCSHVC